MKIEIKRSGGIAGLNSIFLIDQTTATAAEVNEIERLINKSRFFELPTEIPNRKHGADYYTYDISIEVSGKKHTIRTTDFSIPQSLKSIVNRTIEISDRASID